MATTLCRYCGSKDLSTREIEIRQINARTMMIASSQMITEVECRLCGWRCEHDHLPMTAVAFG